MKLSLEWLKNKDIQELIKVLSYAEHNFYFVGGCIRDSLLNLTIKDFDIASNFTPQENMDKLKDCSYTIIPTGLKYGSISININNNIFNITTLRKDIKNYGRDCEVEFNKDLLEDAKRRDFTINALYLNPITGELIDFFNSVEDIKNKKLIFIGEAKDRIQEDYLRILRYFRFYNHLQLNNPPESNLIDNFQQLSNNLNTLSTQRIHKEFIQIINTFKCYKTLYYMQISNVLQQIIPTNLENIQAIENLSALESLNNLHLDTPLIILSILLPCNYNLEDIKLSFGRKYWEKLNHILILRDFIMLHNILDYNEIAKMTINYTFDNMLIAIIATSALKPSQLHIYNNLIELLMKKQQLKLPINGEDLLNIGVHTLKIKSILNILTFEFWNNPLLNKNDLLSLAQIQIGKI